jgi:hypothetical protein
LVLISLNYLKNKSANSPIPFAGGGVSNTMMIDSAPYSAGSSKMMPVREVAPADSSSRMVIQNSSLSLQVKDVATQIKNIESLAKSFGGYLVNSTLSSPESAANGSIVVRVPEAKRTEALVEFKKLAVKVVYESVNGTDVTDQYVDLEAQLDVLQKTKIKYEEILSKATQVNDLLNVQQQLTNLQQQIDSVKGQQQYFSQSAKLSLINVDLSTDDLALPYAPSNEWRPAVVFKEAVRSLVGSFRSVGNILIWAVVYSPLLVPVGLLFWYFKRRV